MVNPSCPGCVNSPDFQVNVNSDGSYALAVDGVTWLNSGNTEFRGNGETFSTSNGSLKVCLPLTSSDVCIMK